MHTHTFINHQLARHCLGTMGIEGKSARFAPLSNVQGLGCRQVSKQNPSNANGAHGAACGRGGNSQGGYGGDGKGASQEDGA